MFSDTLTLNLCVVRVHALVPREISMLQGQNLSFRLSTSSVQSMQEDVENSQETTRRQGSANACWSSQSSIARWPYAENSRCTIRPYPSRLESAFSPRLAAIRIAISRFARAQRTFGVGLGRTLLSLSRKRKIGDPDPLLASPSSAPQRATALSDLVAAPQARSRDSSATPLLCLVR